MTEFMTLLVHPRLIGLNIFIALSSLIVWHAWLKPAQTSVKLIRAFWLCCFSLLAMWLMQQQHHVLNGELLPTPDSPTAVSLRGVTRYVSQRQAWLYQYGILPILVFGLCYVAIERILLRRRGEA
jgi:hypothetical protein